MKKNTEIYGRLDEIQNRLIFIESLQNEEMSKPHHQRDMLKLELLHKDYTTNSFAATQLNWVLE